MEQNLSLYYIFYIVANSGNISKAANELYISQPAISKAIKKLEQNLNITLFTRNSRGVSLTDEGILLYSHIKTAFESIQTGEANIKQIHELGIGHITIGVSSTLCKYMLIPYLKEFIMEYPHINISIECQSSQHTLRLLKENKINIGLVGLSNTNNEIPFYAIDTIHDAFVSTKTYLANLKQRENVHDSNLFQSANLMLLDRENMSRQYIDQYMHENSIETNQILEVSNMDLLIDFARIGMGIACVIREFIIEDLESEHLIEIPLPVKMKERKVGFVFHSENDQSDSTKRFISFIKNRR